VVLEETSERKTRTTSGFHFGIPDSTIHADNPERCKAALVDQTKYVCVCVRVRVFKFCRRDKSSCEERKHR
jgi:hypothetical protein